MIQNYEYLYLNSKLAKGLAVLSKLIISSTASYFFCDCSRHYFSCFKILLFLKMSEIKFIESIRGKKILVFQDYMYEKNREVKNKSYWSCKMKRINGCQSIIHLENNFYIIDFKFS